ncbi:xanthine dehydrogenase accessory protein XdhC [Nitrospira lenta]|uniref:xanthine dehydrogenase accessory protein XdhC n=1 Tax=Nitrospira lenta TaxID=1436998 RepID=UPI0011B75ECA|nr:xanthine dehydrogenase accessory protein XdhC [Nitrospira lenta]
MLACSTACYGSFRTPVIDWIPILQTLLGRQVACVLVLLVQAKGSTPRDVGARMIVTQSKSFGSIGGGTLEYRVIEEARRLLKSGSDQKPVRHLRTWHLGADAGQCCGGECTLLLETVPPLNHAWLDQLQHYQDSAPCVMVTSLNASALSAYDGKLIITEYLAGDVIKESLADDQEIIAPLVRTLLASPGKAAYSLQLVYRKPGDTPPAYLLERYGPDMFRLVLFGAGHVGKAIIRVMSGLPCHITWIDGRPDMFPATVPHNVTTIVSDTHDRIIADAQPGTFFLVMTHSHPLDLDLCEHILRRGDFAYLGLIGSKTKRERFTKRLIQKGLGQGVVRRLTCPIGIRDIPDKDPGVIAVAVAAQILQQRNTIAPVTDTAVTLATLVKV